MSDRKCLARPLAILLTALGLAGCQASAAELTGSCRSFEGKYRIEYVGGALGAGELELLPSPERGDRMQGRLRLWDDTGTQATLELAGPASCEAALVHLTFGAGDHPDAKVRVLGGTATLVPPKGRVERLFGAWEVKVVVKAEDATRSLVGFIREAEAG